MFRRGLFVILLLVLVLALTAAVVLRSVGEEEGTPSAVPLVMLTPPTPVALADQPPTPTLPAATITPVGAVAGVQNATQVAAVASLVPAPVTATLNGVPLNHVLVIPPQVAAHMRTVYARGQALGNDPRAFTRVGDSTIEHPWFMTRFDEPGRYTLGEFAHLQPTIDHFAGAFAHASVAVRRGLHSWAVLDPMWANNAGCNPDESVLACELRRYKPSVIFIRLGTNDAGTPESFRENLQEIVLFALQRGVIPILGTKADRYLDPENQVNAVIREVARELLVPLWDFDVIAQTIPGGGLTPDNVHMTARGSYYDYTQPEAYRTGHGLHNLTALMMLDAVRRTAMM